MITGGRPAVPIISGTLCTNRFSVLPAVVVVYWPKPSSVTPWSSASFKEGMSPLRRAGETRQVRRRHRAR
jgi:hypothetical protein